MIMFTPWLAVPQYAEQGANPRYAPGLGRKQSGAAEGRHMLGCAGNHNAVVSLRRRRRRGRLRTGASLVRCQRKRDFFHRSASCLPLDYGNVAGDENGLPASTTNITSACRSVVPLLETCIGTSAP